MIPLSEYLRSVEGIALVWLGSVLLLGLLTRAGLRSIRWRSLLPIWHREEGAAYSLAYVLTMPLYVYLVCLVVESTLLLVVKVGTVYATFAAARSAVVWLPAEPHGQAHSRASLAAQQALTPFASSSKFHADGSGGDASDYVREAGKRIKGASSAEYLRAKFLYAQKATTVRILGGDPPRQDEPVRVRLTYLAPVYVPGLGPLFGRRSPWGGSYHVVEMTSEVTLTDEVPRSADGRLGIRYESQ